MSSRGELMAAGTPGPGRRAGPAQQEEGGGSLVKKILQGLAIWYGMQLLIKQFTNRSSGSEGNATAAPKDVEIPAFQHRPQSLDEGASYSPFPRRIAPIWPSDSVVDVVVTISPSHLPLPISQTPAQYRILSEKAFRLSNHSDTRTVETTFQVPEQVQNNGTLWGHFYVGLTGAQLDPEEADFDSATAMHFAYPLTSYLPTKKDAKTRNLLESKAEVQDDTEEDRSVGPIISSYYHPNTTLAFVPGMGVLNLAETPASVQQYINLESSGARDGTGQVAWYYPILYVSKFWSTKARSTLLNDTVTTLPIRMHLKNMRPWIFNLQANIDWNAKTQARKAQEGSPLGAGGDGSEVELVKEIFIDGNPYLLGITAIASVAHMVMEMLAFGSDIAHYRKKKDNVGISVRSILANVFMSLVIFLYLLDNSQNTSWMILASQGVSILIEMWKITTVINIRLRPATAGSWLPYRIAFEDKYKLSETEEKTKEYDKIAYKYMTWLACPLLLAYAIYSLVYDSHKSWYSFCVTTAVGAVYAYGFLLMLPSLYINYRLKSVAHMPGKAMIYKFLGTFLDDLMAFAVKMPLLYRLGTFRDDIVFFIYLYQRYAYKVDKNRVNEFGQGGDDEDLKAEQEQQVSPHEHTAEPKQILEADNMAERVVGGSGKVTKRR